MSVFASAVLAAEESGVDLNPFKPEFGLYVWVTIAFGVVLFLLAKKVFPKLEETLADREQRIKASLEQAEQTKLEAEKLLEDYRSRVAGVREEADRIAEDVRQQAKAAAQDLIARTEAESREILAKAQAQLAGERDRTVSQLQGQLADWAVQIASRIVDKELSPESHRHLIESFIEDLRREGQPS